MAYILSLCINISLGKLPILPTPIIKFDNDFKLLGCYQDSDVKCFPYDRCFVKVSFFPLSIIFGFVLFLAGLGFPGSSDGKEYTCNAGDLSSVPGLGKSPGGGHWQPTPIFLPGEFRGQRSLAGCSPWGRKESDTTERLGTATALGHSCGTRDPSLVRGSLVVAHGVSCSTVCGILVPQQGI